MKRKKALSLLTSLVMVISLMVGCGTEEKKENDVSGSDNEKTELTLLIDTEVNRKGIEAVAELAEKEIGIKIKLETRPGGPDGLNLIKTRLASGDMSDMVVYTSGALLKELNPSQYFIDLSEEECAERLDDGYKEAASDDGKLYGVPFTSGQVYAVIYSKPMYEKYNLQIPKTWDEFMNNCEVLQNAGETAIVGSYSDVWTTQIPFLGDAYNLQMTNPEFAEQFTNGEAKWATTPEALRSFEKLAETSQYFNKDYMATTYNDACDIMATGGAGHWVILTQALSNVYSLYGEAVNDLGAFPIPSDDESISGFTMFYPTSICGNKNSDKVDDIIKFMNFYTTDEALDAYTAAIPPDGPYCIKEYQMPDSAYDAIKNDIQKYFNENKVLPAMEYVSPVKGSDCPAICQELGSGQTTAKEAAEKYDNDCYKRAIQIGLPW